MSQPCTCTRHGYYTPCSCHSYLFRLIDHVWDHKLAESEIIDLILSCPTEEKLFFMVDNFQSAPKYLRRKIPRPKVINHRTLFPLEYSYPSQPPSPPSYVFGL